MVGVGLVWLVEGVGFGELGLVVFQLGLFLGGEDREVAGFVDGLLMSLVLLALWVLILTVDAVADGGALACFEVDVLVGEVRGRRGGCVIDVFVQGCRCW